MPVLEEIAEVVDRVRQRFNICRRGYSFVEIAKSTDIPRAQLSIFASGGRINFEAIATIEHWCAQKETARDCSC